MYVSHDQPAAATRRSETPFPRILCAVDGSVHAGEVVAQALALAAVDSQVTFLSVAEDSGFGSALSGPSSRGCAEDVLERAACDARDAGVEAVSLIRHGRDARRVILDEARAFDLLVLGARGRHRNGGYLVGSTPVTALHHSPVPVLVARRPRAGTPFPQRILLATDGSPVMGPTVVLTAALARLHDASVTLLYVDHPGPDIDLELANEAAAFRAATGVEPVTMHLDGHAPTRIAEVALELPASLVVTGSRMLTGHQAMGSVSERVGIVSPCSVLVVRGANQIPARMPPRT